jgi:NADPH-dependent glutamate synthase beta subunit-like oxidoreductase/Fe-S-cluster-containing hydrogenase component 2
MAREVICQLGKMITSRIPYKMGLKKLTEDDPEYYILDLLCSDELANIMLKMELRKPKTLEEIAAITGTEPAHLEEVLKDAAMKGVVEYNWDNPQHVKKYYVQIFVPGIAEMTNMNLEQVEKYPKLAKEFNRLTFLPLAGMTEMIPPGGGGAGMHVIPVEKAIPAESQSVSIEHLSHWLKKYEGQIGVGYCSCRNAARLAGQGCGELQDELCISVGTFNRYVVETGRGHAISYDEAMRILQRAEDNGYVHQITNIDGENKIFAICNCEPGVCFALRTSQLFNTPNMSASAYRAHVETKNCVACGKCVEVCPAGAAKLGQKLCTKDGPIQYPKQELPDDNHWGEEKWNKNYMNDNERNCHESGTSPCKSACPAHIAIQGYIKMAGEGRYLDALKLIKKDNPFPAVCGSICNRRCEDECTRGSVDRAVAIDEIKKFLAERELNEKDRYIPPKVRHKTPDVDYVEKIAVIGAGPAGLSCAYYLAEMGYANVTVFDRNKVPGGMLALGIPSFRLEKNVLNAEIDVLKKMGVKFKCGVEVGKDVTIAELRKQGYMGFYIAIGAQKSARLNVPGEDLNGVWGGVDFLREVNLGNKINVGKSVAVVGGGNVAMDVVRTVVRLGAEHAYIVYRRSEAELPADPEEVAEAMAEGVKFCYLNAPVEITGTADGKVNGLKVELMELGDPDEKGRRKPVSTGKFKTLKVNTVIGAIGQTIDWGGLDVGALKTDKKGRAEADAVTYQTAESDIFVGGDVVTGPKFAIDAIAAGREGATSLHRFVHQGQSLTLARNPRDFYELDKKNAVVPVDCFDAPARQEVRHDPKKAMTFKNDRVVFTEEMVKKEASRCLGCGACIVDQNRCIGCGLCTTRCEFDAIHLFRDHPECSKMYSTEEMVKAVLPYAAKRAAKIAVKDLRQKTGK